MNNKITFFLLASCLIVASARTNKSYKDIINASVKNLGGINCLINSVNDIEDFANDFIYETKSCDIKASKSINNLLKDCEDLKDAAENILRLNNKTCKSTSYDNKRAPSDMCVRLFKKRMEPLIEIVERTTKDTATKNIQNSCHKMAATKLNLKLKHFESAGKVCGEISV